MQKLTIAKLLLKLVYYYVLHGCLYFTYCSFSEFLYFVSYRRTILFKIEVYQENLKSMLNAFNPRLGKIKGVKEVLLLVTGQYTAGMMSRETLQIQLTVLKAH